jgi:hypothetical protein
VPTRYRASSSITDRLAAESSRRPAPAPAVGGGGGGRASAARQAETPARREDGRETGRADAGLAATGATARKDWSEFMADAEDWSWTGDGDVFRCVGNFNTTRGSSFGSGSFQERYPPGEEGVSSCQRLCVCGGSVLGIKRPWGPRGSETGRGVGACAQGWCAVGSAPSPLAG